MLPHVHDLVSTRNANLYSGKAFAITDVSSLPSDFTSTFIAAACEAGSAYTCPEREMPNSAKIGIQIFVTAKGVGFSKLTAQLQASNTGGTATQCWANIGTATELADTGSAFYTLPTDMYAARHAKFYRMVLTATGGTCTTYVIAYGYNEG